MDSFNINRIRIGGAAVAASLALAACGGSETPAQNTRDGATVAVQSIGGTDGVLVDAAGKPLYAADVEAGGNIRCVAACVSFWKPLTVASGAPTAASSRVGKLGVVERPDGARQVTAGGKPLYRFAEDGAGQLKGDGFEDQFGGRHFKWSAVLAGGKVGASSGSSGGGDGGRGGYSGY